MEISLPALGTGAELLLCGGDLVVLVEAVPFAGGVNI